MKPMQSFLQLRLRFHVREFTRRHGRKPSRNEYFRLRYRLDVERRRDLAREADRAARRRRYALWLIDAVRRAER
jgi:hypothetical protein